MALMMKICLLGDGAVGKTSLRRVFIGQHFIKEYIMTVGADFAIKEIAIPSEYDKDVDLKFQIWDLAGQPRFKEVRPKYYQGVKGAILVFDVTRKDSLANLANWINELDEITNSELPYVIIGNKTDIRRKSKAHVTTAQAKKYIDKTYNCEYLETSAKTGKNVTKAFELIGSELVKTLSKDFIKKL